MVEVLNDLYSCGGVQKFATNAQNTLKQYANRKQNMLKNKVCNTVKPL